MSVLPDAEQVGFGKEYQDCRKKGVIDMNTPTIREYRLFEKAEYNPDEFSYTLPTEDDLPYDDGDVMETERHKEQMNLLIDSLKACWKDSRKYYTGGNMFLHFEIGGAKQFKGPDFFLVMNADSRERKSWVVWQENMKFPDIIIELLSDSTRETDKKDKKKLYSQVSERRNIIFTIPFPKNSGDTGFHRNLLIKQ